ncbi:hypothetical protein FQN60_014740, partial [Etheostoma spectabile]
RNRECLVLSEDLDVTSLKQSTRGSATIYLSLASVAPAGIVMVLGARLSCLRRLARLQPLR